jgi:hypothetical protein
MLGEGVSTWPMADELARTIGIRLRDEASGTKRAVKGSRNGLFIPRMIEQELVLVTEGESDTAAALTLGCFAIGRPGCSGGTELLVRWLRRRAERDIAIVCDADAPGMRGAAELAVTISGLARTVRIVVGPRCWKDLRLALANEYTRANLRDDVEDGLLVRPIICVACVGADSTERARRIEIELTRRVRT